MLIQRQGLVGTRLASYAEGARQLTFHAGIYEQDVLVSAYGPDRTEVVEAGGGGYRVPISWPLTAAGQETKIIIVLRRGDQILTSSGRRSLVWPTGESQVFTTQAIHSDGVRSFDASPEDDDDLSQDEDSIPHDGPGGFVHAIISNMSLVPPPPPRADIILERDPAERDEIPRTPLPYCKMSEVQTLHRRKLQLLLVTPDFSPREPDRGWKNCLLT
jgi:hypothetical protein